MDKVSHFQLGLTGVAEPLTELAMWEPVDQIPSSVIFLLRTVVASRCEKVVAGAGSVRSSAGT